MQDTLKKRMLGRAGKPWMRLLAGGMTLAAATLMAAPMAAQAQSTGSGAKDTSTDKPRRVVVIFKNGNKVEGELLSEGDATIRMRVTVGTMKAETDYNRADILEIKDVEAAAAADEKAKPAAPAAGSAAAPAASSPAAAPTAGASTGNDLSGLAEDDASSWGDQKWRITTRAVPSEPNGPKVYVIQMRGEFGRDVAATPMKEVLRDIKKYQPEYLVLFYDHDFAYFGEEMADFDNDLQSFNTLERARELAAVLVDDIRRDSEFQVKPKLVSWVRKAMGGAAFLPFIAREIYYTSDGMHGGIGYTEHMFDGRGDERAREKQISLRMARAEGLVEMGGHEKLILRAMARTDFVLSYKLENGKPVFLPNKYPENADEILLTDDGKETRSDTMGDVIRGLGNDSLTVKADLALRLGLSSGTADSLDDLMDRMGVSRNYVVIKGRGNQILREWSKQVGDAERQLNRLAERFVEVRVRAPGDYAARTRARGERKQILLQMKAIMDKYMESLNPRRLEGRTRQLLGSIEPLLQNIAAEQLADKPERR